MAEYWDLYDKERGSVGKLHRRGDPLPEGCYHLVVQVWVRRDDGRYLISQRHPAKMFPLFWECSGGGVVAGEDSLTSARRELAEEVGLALPAEAFEHVNAFTIDDAQAHYDTYICRWTGELRELTLQDIEVVDAKWATPEEIRALCDDGKFMIPKEYIPFR